MENTLGLAGLTITSAATESDGTHNKVWYLQQSPLSANIGDDGMSDIDGVFVMREYPRKSLVFDIGDTERTIFMVKRGAIRIVRLTPEGKEVTVTMLAPGAIFGEEMLFGSMQRTTFAVATEDTLLCSARADAMFALLQRNAALASNVAGMLQSRLESAHQTIEDLSVLKLSERLINLFARLADEHGVPRHDGTEIDLRLTHAEIASMVGASRESVSVEVANLVRARAIRVQAGHIVVCSAAELPRS